MFFQTGLKRCLELVPIHFPSWLNQLWDGRRPNVLFRSLTFFQTGPGPGTVADLLLGSQAKQPPDRSEENIGYFVIYSPGWLIRSQAGRKPNVLFRPKRFSDRPERTNPGPPKESPPKVRRKSAKSPPKVRQKSAERKSRHGSGGASGLAACWNPRGIGLI